MLNRDKWIKKRFQLKTKGFPDGLVGLGADICKVTLNIQILSQNYVTRKKCFLTYQSYAAPTFLRAFRFV